MTHPAPRSGAGEARADEVDALVAAWRQELPGLDVSPLEVLSRVTRVARLLDDSRSAAYSAHGIATWEFDVLAALRRSGDPYTLSPGGLTFQTHVTSGTMTTRVGHLVDRGMVTREAHPDDGRGVLVTLTPAGKGVVDAALADLLVVEERMLGDLTAEERSALASQLRRLLLTVQDAE